jgi:hypothetical protein
VRAAVVAVAASAILAACTTERLTEPTQTADEQLLVSVAIDHAVDQLQPSVPPGTKVFLDGQYIDALGSGAQSKYLIASLRDHLLRGGVRLVDDRGSADMVAEVRSGAEAINHRDVLFGIPAIPVPVPLTGTLVTPKIALYEHDQQTGVAKIALTTYDKTGALNASSGLTYGLSKKTHWVVLLLISGNKSDLLPKNVKP